MASSKRNLLISTIFLVAATFNAIGQNVSLKTVSLLPSDLMARTQPRNDNNGQPCAIIKVGIVNVDDMVFPDAVGDVRYDACEYVVYVPGGLKSLKYSSATSGLKGEIKLDNDYGIEIERQRTYRILFDREDHQRVAIFAIDPPTAKLTLDGQKVSLDKFGLARKVLPIGNYSYRIQADGYQDCSGTVSLTEDELAQTVSISLEQRTYQVRITTSPSNASLFIDNINQSQSYNNGNYQLELGEGKHKIRLTAENYKDFEKNISIPSDGFQFVCKMEAAKAEVVKHKEEQTKTEKDFRSFVYVSIGGDLFQKDNEEGFKYDGKIELGYQKNWRYIALRPLSFAGGFVGIDDDEYGPYGFVEYTPSVGCYLPFYYNKHAFTALVGGYYRWVFDSSGDKVDVIADYGLKIQTVFFFHKFFIGIEARKSLKKEGVGYFGGLSLGYKFQIKNK